MATKNIFVSNGKNINIGNGKIDLATATATFKTKVQMFTDGINTMIDKMSYWNDRLETEKHSLELYLQQPNTDTVVIAAKEADIKKFEAEKAEVAENIKDAMPEYDAVDKNLFYAYRQFIREEVEKSVYIRAFAEFLDANGIIPTEKGIELLSSRIGIKKASAKTTFKSGGVKFTDAMGEKQYLDLIYRTIGEFMYQKSILRPFTYEWYVEKKKNTTK